MDGELPDPRGSLLLHLARTAIEERLHAPADAWIAGADELRAAPWLLERAASFVSLHRLGRLRGCVGSLEPRRPLHEDVTRNALAAAFSDSRFSPIEARELAALTVEVTLLAPRERIRCRSEREAIHCLRPGVDGLVLGYGARRATFLPQVWESLPEPEQFLAALKEKAGLPAGFWDGAIVLERYAAWSWSEGDRV